MPSTLTQKIQALGTERRSRLRGMIVSAAEGADLDPLEVESLLRDCGYSPEDFARSVSKLKSRIEAARQLEEADAMSAAVREANRAHQAASAAFQEFKERQKSELEAEREKLSALWSAVRRLEGEQSKLRTEAAEVLNTSASQHLRSTAELELQIRELEYRINSRRQLPKRPDPDRPVEVAAYEKALAELRAANAADQERKKEVEQAIKAMRRQRLEVLATDLI